MHYVLMKLVKVFPMCLLDMAAVAITGTARVMVAWFAPYLERASIVTRLRPRISLHIRQRIRKEDAARLVERNSPHNKTTHRSQEAVLRINRIILTCLLLILLLECRIKAHMK